jgi:hypothetical protein
MFAWILKTKPVKASLSGVHRADGGLARHGGRGELQEGAEEGLHAEVRQRAPEVRRRHLTGQECLRRELLARHVQQLDLVVELL